MVGFIVFSPNIYTHCVYIQNRIECYIAIQKWQNVKEKVCVEYIGI